MRHHYNSVSLCPAYSAGRKSLGGGGGEGKGAEGSEKKGKKRKGRDAGGRERLIAKDKVREGRRR